MNHKNTYTNIAIYMTRPYNVQYTCHALHYGTASCNLILWYKERMGVEKASLEIKCSQSAVGDHINQSGHTDSFQRIVFLLD